MTVEQRNNHRTLYNQLRLALVYPGEIIAEQRRPYEPVDKWLLSYDELMAAPDTPNIARMRARGDKSLLFRLGRHEQPAA